MRDDGQDQISRAVAEIMAARPVFKVGDRVRGLDRECKYCEEWHDQEVGATGTVVEVGNDDRPYYADDASHADFLAHPIWVELDVPIDGCDWSHFAPTELELVP